MFQQGLRYQGDGPALAVLALYGAFINNVVIAMFFILGHIFLFSDWRRQAGLATVCAIAVLSHFAQFKWLAFVVVAVLLGAPARILVLTLVAALIAIYTVALSHVPEVMMLSPNSGIRLAFIFDALKSLNDTDGLGIGYGTESVRWRYQFPNMAEFTFLPDPRSITPDRMLELLSVGVHNSFVQALLRTGLLGFGLLTAALFAAFPAHNLPRDACNHAAVVFMMIFIACFVNPSLETPIAVVGVGFGYGYLLALRANARSPHPLRR